MVLSDLSPGGGSPLRPGSKIARFWAAYGNEMDDPQAMDDCTHFGKRFKLDHGCATIGCMERLLHSQVCGVLGTRKRLGWVGSVEGLLEHQFTRLSASVPASAHMGEGMGSATGNNSNASGVAST